MSLEFEGHVALVTAAAGAGIGQAVARRLAAGGASLVVSDIHERRTKEVSEAIARDYPKVRVAGPKRLEILFRRQGRRTLDDLDPHQLGGHGFTKPEKE